ncbi:MAG: hypothetical protein QF466_03465 [Desulfobacterales bacterium]|jgi:hypothetical protein|nr:hypothetical protein [Desulfobacter sp.]MDP6394497.1 hypothetical protein [Desulfobacterales bacterium]MDP6806205.1 hypothetical protein [Desulfobacterales bacterium]|tara:strand:+ start:2515 stop:2874 length:360 start_codon:yes stop_codon:yes gene_type:complete
MLTKLTNTLFFRLFPLLSALFIAAGVPLLHPILHSHSESYHITSEHHDEHIPTFVDKDHEPNCLICGFLATSQLHATGIGRTSTYIEPVGILISIMNVFSAKIFPLQIAPRAPPAANSY